MKRAAIIISLAFPLLAAAGEDTAWKLLSTMTRDEAAEGRSVCVTGVVTMVASWRLNNCVISPPDDPNGTAVFLGGGTDTVEESTLEGMDALRTGQIVEATGRTARFSFSPGIQVERFRLIGEMELPPPPERSLDEFDFGRLDNRRAAISGVLMEAKNGFMEEGETNSPPFVRLSIATPKGPFAANVTGAPEDWRSLVDAEVRVEGCAMSFFNLRAEFLGVQVEVMDPKDVKMLACSPGDPFDLPVSHFDVLSPPVIHMPGMDSCHRLKVRGVVTYAKNGNFFYMQRGDCTLRVRTAAGEPLKVGDEVEAVGFPQMHNGTGEMVAAIYRVVGHGAAIPEAMSDLENFDSIPFSDGTIRNLDGMAVSIPARWVCKADSGYDALAYVMIGSRLVKIKGDEADLNVPGDWDDWSPTVQDDGVCSIALVDGLPEGRGPGIRDIDIYIDDTPGRGVRLVKDKKYVAHVRQMFFRSLGYAALSAILGVLAWMGVRWRRQVLEARHQAAIISERKRMAGDLHDSIEQHIAGVRLMLNTARTYGGDMSPNISEALDAADGILARAKAEIRDAVWNLRSDEIFSMAPKDVLRNLAKRISSTGATRVRTALQGLPDALDSRVFAEIVYIVQEAITNAVKHGKAKNVAITVDPVGGGFELNVVNDGEPFDGSAALGEEAGHFGLSNMKDRARKAGLAFSFVSRDGWSGVKLGAFHI